MPSGEDKKKEREREREKRKKERKKGVPFPGIKQRGERSYRVGIP